MIKTTENQFNFRNQSRCYFIAEALDYERKTKGVSNSLHGIPVLLKDNIETNDSMHTSAGTIALEQNISSEDAFLVTKLREAGAVIIGKRI